MSSKWWYLSNGQVRHLKDEGQSYSYCGKGVLWFSNEKWKNDTKGLMERRWCKLCIKIRRVRDAKESAL